MGVRVVDDGSVSIEVLDCGLNFELCAGGARPNMVGASQILAPTAKLRISTESRTT